MSLTSFSSFSAPKMHSQIAFGYNSTMKHVATEHHAHCAYGGEELNDRNPATAEHVKCHSAGGPNTDSNFLPVCQKHNGERASIPLPKFLASHPKAWENIKQTILELNGVKEPNFDGHRWAETIVKTVEKESGKHMDIELGDTEESNGKNYSSRRNDFDDSDNEVDKTLTTRTGKKIYVGEHKPMNFFA